MDIRSFFGGNKGSPSPKQKSSGKKKKRLVISDSDDDEIVELPVKKQKTAEVKSIQKKPQVLEKKAAAPSAFFGSEKIKKESKAADFFGTGHVTKQSKPEIKKTDKPIAPEIKKTDKPKETVDLDFSDDELFDDDEFNQTIEDLERGSKKPKENVTPPKGKESLSEKLAAKRQVASWKERIGQTDKGISQKPEQSVSEKRKRPRDNEEDKPIVTPVREPRAKSGETPSTAETPGTPSSQAGTPSGKAGYWAYKNREGPKNLGNKDVPTGAPNCLEGLTFVISGVLDSIERDAAADLIKRYGGRVTSAVSKKTNYLVKGDDVGAKKLEMAEKLKTKQIDEDGLFDLIKSKPGKKSAYDIKVEKENPKQAVVRKTGPAAQSSVKKDSTYFEDEPKLVKKEHLNSIVKEEPPNSIAKEEPSEQTSVINKGKHSNLVEKKEPSKSGVKKEEADRKPLLNGGSGKTHVKKEAGVKTGVTEVHDQWTEKYRPKRVKDIIGQQGDRSNVKKLLNWLKRWEGWHKPGNKPPFNKDEGSHFKAALLSGPPGVGKTTSATVCAKELGFSFYELNASDARSKKSIKEHVKEVLNNHTISGLTQKGAKGDRHLLIMDEVDGMAGNEDRGGIGELIALIKTSRIPIICICNDRNHQKIRSLSNHCFDLRFYKPRVEQVKGAMMSIAFKEGLRISPPAMQKIVEGANSDIRQILNQICVWTAGSKSLSFDQASSESSAARKDMNISLFDIPKLLFTAGEETRKYTYRDYTDLFFQDYSMTPFFVHENYPRSTPIRLSGAKNRDIKHLVTLANAADSICFGDQISSAIKMQNWSLLPNQAHFSAIMPSFYMRGGIHGMVNFPQILGQTSKTRRVDGLLQDLLHHMILHVSTDKRQLGMDYLPLLKHRLVNPMLKKENEGVPEVLATMSRYDLLRDDWDSVMELSTYSPNPSPAANLSTKTKTAFTRLFNKQSHMNPYAVDAGPAKKKTKKKASSADNEPSDGDVSEEDEDVMLKPNAKKAPAKKAAPKKTVSKAGSSKSDKKPPSKRSKPAKKS